MRESAWSTLHMAEHQGVTLIAYLDSGGVQADGGFRFVFKTDQSQSAQALQLMALQGMGVQLAVVLVPEFGDYDG